MTLELIVFIAAILFGALLYWRESQGNKLYRFFNKLMYSKELQMKPEDKKGFFYQQTFLLRLVYITFLFLVGILITRFLIPIDLATISLFASMIAGSVLGTYLAGFIFKSSEVIDEKSDSLEDMVQDTIEKGKDFIEEIKSKDTIVEEAEVKDKIEENSEEAKKKCQRTIKRQRILIIKLV